MRVNPPNETTIMHSNIVQRFLNSHVTNSDIDIAFWFGRHSADNRFYGKTSHFHRSNGKRLLYAGADRYDQCRYFLVLLSSGGLGGISVGIRRGIAGSEDSSIHYGAHRNITQCHDRGGNLSHPPDRSGKGGCQGFNVSNFGSVHLFFRCHPQFS